MDKVKKEAESQMIFSKDELSMLNLIEYPKIHSEKNVYAKWPDQKLIFVDISQICLDSQNRALFMHERDRI